MDGFCVLNVQRQRMLVVEPDADFPGCLTITTSCRYVYIAGDDVQRLVDWLERFMVDGTNQTAPGGACPPTAAGVGSRERASDAPGDSSPGVVRSLRRLLGYVVGDSHVEAVLAYREHPRHEAVRCAVCDARAALNSVPSGDEGARG